MSFTVEISDLEQLQRTLAQVREVQGVLTREQAIVETELKLLLAPQDLRRLRRDPRIKALQQGRASTRRVHSVYYDTPELSLLRAGLALRLRSDGGAGCRR